MNLRNWFIGLLLVVIVAAFSYVGYQKLILPKHACDICGRETYPRLQAHVFLKDGGRVEACCPRCALHLYLEKPSEVARIAVEDSVTGEPIEAQRAIYLEGSEADGCHPGAKLSPRGPGVLYDVKFDRCLPSLIAFKSEAGARESQKRSGGRLLSFTQTAERVRQR